MKNRPKIGNLANSDVELLKSKIHNVSNWMPGDTKIIKLAPTCENVECLFRTMKIITPAHRYYEVCDLSKFNG